MVSAANGLDLGDVFSVDPRDEDLGIDDYEWADAPSMVLPRASPAVVVLSDGNILVTGGLTSTGPTASTEIFNVTLDSWRPGPAMTVKRVGHTATLLEDGTVLVAGGDTGSGTTASAEILDIKASATYLLPSMYFARSAHAAARLLDGNVLVTGGTDWVTGIWFQAELYNTTQHSWFPAGSMAKARVSFTMHLLSSGDALAVGGDSAATSEKYDPKTNSWSGTAQMNMKRYSAASTMLVSGKVLVAGGLVDTNPIRSAELYDPATNSWAKAGNMTAARASFSLSVLPGGVALAAGSYSKLGTTASTEAYYPGNNTWWAAKPMNHSRGSHGSAVVESGKMLLVMGGWSSGVLTASVERFSIVPPVPPPPSKYCMPIDLVPLVLAATELPGNSQNGLLAKLYAAQKQYDEGDYAVCLNIMTAFYNELRGFTQSGHITKEHSDAIYAGYVAVVTCIGGTPLPPIEVHGSAGLRDKKKAKSFLVEK